MKLRIAADHAGFKLKEFLKKNAPDIEWEDLGTQSEESTHYPKYAQVLCEQIIDTAKVADELLQPKGVLVCGSGQGMAMQANRYVGIRAALCWNEDVARTSREHNASNVLCLAGRFTSEAEAVKIFRAWISAPFQGGRHADRIHMMDHADDCGCC